MPYLIYMFWKYSIVYYASVDSKSGADRSMVKQEFQKDEFCKNT